MKGMNKGGILGKLKGPASRDGVGGACGPSKRDDGVDTGWDSHQWPGGGGSTDHGHLRELQSDQNT